MDGTQKKVEAIRQRAHPLRQIGPEIAAAPYADLKSAAKIGRSSRPMTAITS